MGLRLQDGIDMYFMNNMLLSHIYALMYVVVSTIV